MTRESRAWSASPCSTNHVNFQPEEDPPGSWRVHLSRNDEVAAQSVFCFSALEAALLLFSSVLERETARWVSMVSFECPVE
ncbi:hypothetical protein ACFL2T_03795 [Elusimicrobiota bacterium]